MGTLSEAQADAMREWIHRLRSGDRRQGKGALHTEVVGVHQYCSLGVAAEMAAEQRVIESQQTAVPIQPDSDATLQAIVHSYDGSISRATRRLCAFLGIDVLTACRLMWMNDQANKTFAEIADFLEQEFLSDHDRPPRPAHEHPAESVGPRTA